VAPLGQGESMSTSMITRAAAVAALTTLLIIVGFVATPTHHANDSRFHEQNDEVRLTAGEEKDIYFKTPYAGKPELVVKDDWTNNLKVIECTPDHFRVRNDNYCIVQATWTATGDRASVAPAPAPTPPLQPIPPNTSK
jgi:hypothetical protein